MYIHLLFTLLPIVAAGVDCNPPEPKYSVALSYDKQPENKTYPEGTNVTANCKEEGMKIREGSSAATCRSGTFVPELGRCPYHCSMKGFFEKKGYTNQEGFKPEPYPKVDVNNEWRKHGTGAYAACMRFVLGIYESFEYPEWHYWDCKDGGWQPHDEKYQSC